MIENSPFYGMEYERFETNDDPLVAFMDGSASADELFDPLDFELPEHDYSYKSDNGYFKRIETMQLKNMSDDDRSNLCLEVQRKANLGLEYGVEMDKLVTGNVRFISWFVRETMGFHKQSNIANGKKPIKSNLNPNSYLHDYSGAPLDYADRFQVATLGFMRAVMRHDPEKGKLFSIAKWYMEADIFREIENTSHNYVARIPNGIQANMRKVLGLVRSKQNQGLTVNLDEATSEIEIDKNSIEFAVAVLRRMKAVSLEQALSLIEADYQEYPEDEMPIAIDGPIDDRQLDIDEAEEQAMTLYETLNESMSCLSERQDEIIRFRFGLDIGTRMTLEEVGRLVGVTRERVRQIEGEALKKLRHSKLWEAYIDAESRWGYMYNEYDLGVSAPIFSGLPRYLKLTEDQRIKLGIDDPIIFDRTPSRRQIAQKTGVGTKKFVYLEDWSD